MIANVYILISITIHKTHTNDKQRLFPETIGQKKNKKKRRVYSQRIRQNMYNLTHDDSIGLIYFTQYKLTNNRTISHRLKGGREEKKRRKEEGNEIELFNMFVRLPSCCSGYSTWFEKPTPKFWWI